MAKINPRVASNVLCGNDTNWPPRAAINRALSEKIFAKRPRSRIGRKPKPQPPPVPAAPDPIPSQNRP